MNYEETFFRNVYEKYQKASLDNCNLIPKHIVDFCREYALNPTSLVITGGYGTGKTYLVFAIVREIFRKNPKRMWPRFFTSPELDSIFLKASKSDDGDGYEIESKAKEDLLIIDDLGRETKSDRLKRQYFELFNYRYARELPTIVTSNYNLEQLGEVLDGSIASRMQEWQLINFKGADVRQFLGANMNGIERIK